MNPETSGNIFERLLGYFRAIPGKSSRAVLAIFFTALFAGAILLLGGFMPRSWSLYWLILFFAFSLLFRILTVMRPEERPKALLLMLNSFLIIFGYYIIKPVREALLLEKHPATIKSYLAAAQAVLLIFVVKAFSRVASRFPRHLLISWVTLFFIYNLLLFFILDLAGVSVAVMGIVFFIWIGIFNLLVVAQFWGFANDLYSEDAGKRLFPLIAFGATFGGVVGPILARRLFKPIGSYRMMLVTAGILILCILLTLVIHKRDVKEKRQGSPGTLQVKTPIPKAPEQPLEKGGGFQLIFRNRYLLYIALVIGIYNFINALGEYMFSDLQRKTAMRAIEAGAAGGADLGQAIGMAFANYQSLTNILALLIQLFLVSRIFRWVGIGGALLFLPAIVLGGYGYLAFGTSLVFLKWVKALENGTDYSLMNTTKAALFLVTKREEKYKAKAAIDTFFVRGGDTLQAIVVFLGTSLLALSIEGFAVINVVSICVWIFLCILIIREYKKMKARFEAAQTG